MYSAYASVVAAAQQEIYRVGSFGAQLKNERERRGITLEEVSASTKIGTRFLRALEEEQFEQLPGGIFNRGFVRAYARQLGLDEEQTVTEYLHATGEDKPAVSLTITPAEEPAPTVEQQNKVVVAFHVPWGGIAVVLMVVAFGFAIWGFHSREVPKDRGQEVSEETPKPAPVNRVVEPLKRPLQTTSTPAPSPTNPPSAVATVAPSIATSTNTASPPPRTDDKVATSVSRPTRVGNFSVLIKAREECWLSIISDGKLSEVVLQGGEQQSVVAGGAIILKAGNVGAVDLWFNGKKLPAQGYYGEVKTLAFDANGVRQVVTKPAGQTEQP